MKKRMPIGIFLIPIILVLVLVAVFQGNEKFSSDPDSTPAPDEKPELSKYNVPGIRSDGSSSAPELSFDSRIPVYPNSKKLALKGGSDVTEAAFFGTSDSLDAVKQWYFNYLSTLDFKPAVVDITMDGVRTVTISMPDYPKELVELKKMPDESGRVMITITTLEFYTRNQPRPVDFSEIDEDNPENEADKSNDNNIEEEKSN